PDLAGRGEPWLALAASDEAWAPSLELLGATAELGESAIGGAAGFDGAASDAANGHWIVSKPFAGALRLVAGADVAASEIALLELAGDGSGVLLRWSLPALPAGACLRGLLVAATPALELDETCDGSAEATLAPASESVAEPAPQLLAAVQDETVLAGRPAKPCPRTDIANYGTVVAVLFSKPMTQASVDVPAAYALDDGNAARSVQIQPGGRVALLNLAAPIGAIRARTLRVAPSVTDPRGTPLAGGALPVATTAEQGVAIRGIVVRGSGEPAVDVPVTLTMYDEVSGFECEPFVTRPAQARTDAEGRFSFDYVPAGIPYSVSATDTTGIGRAGEALVLAASDDDQLDRARLLELAGGSAQGTLLEAFAVGALPEAIAAAEGLDRALLRDAVGVGSARVGSEVPVALRFRGRGTVAGTVLASDGTTPAPGSAVNLFPDPDSRELGRGVVADASGRFAFFGVPLGAFTLEATSPSGRTRIVSDVLAAPGETKDVRVVLSAAAVSRGAIEGRVLEPGGGGGHANARVFVGRFDPETGRFEDVVAVVTADADGFFRADAVPVGGWDLVAASFDGRRRGERRGVQANASATAIANVTLQSRTVVRGRVEFANGAPGGFALVAGGEAVVRADADGNFELLGVPTGPRSIEAAVEADPARGIEFTRLGSASLDVVAGVENFTVVRLVPAGRILGIVRDAAGNAVPNVDVSIPQQGGFLWVHADAQGRFAFPNLPLDDYTVSAPAPPHEDTDVTGILDVLSGSPTSAELQAAIAQAFEIFTGVNDPLLSGEGLQFNPLSWGFERTSLDFDGQTRFVDVRFLPEGTVAGRVLNGQGVPIGARVRLTGVGPTKEGDVGFVVRGERNSDPALGTFEFRGQALAGDFGVQAASPFFPSVISAAGRTTRVDPDRTDLVLQFPSENLVNGRLAGRVLAPDGAPVADARVRISFGDLTIRTDATGRFDTQLDLPAVNAKGERIGYAVEAEDETSGLRGQSFVTLQPGVANSVDVRLIPRGGALRVRVLDALGAPVAGAAIEVQQGGFPGERFGGVSDADGELALANLFEGSYSAHARAVAGATASEGRAGASVQAGVESLAVVRLGGAGAIRGRFVALDRTTPIGFAQVRIGEVGFAATDADGRFEVAGVPLGTHRVVAQDALTGRLGIASVPLTAAGQIAEVLVVERALGELFGAVIDGFGSRSVPGAHVTLRVADGVSPQRTVTADPSGVFSFPGTPAGAFTLSAEDPATDFQGAASGVLPEGSARLQVDVALQPLTNASFLVLEPGGLAPADATVTLALANGSLSLDTDAAGRVVFESVPLCGACRVSARSRVAGQSRSAAAQSVTLDVRGAQPEVTLVLSGVGRVEGRLFASDGTTPVASRAVELTILADGQSGTIAAQTGADGAFAMDDVPVGPFRLVGRDGALAATDNGAIERAGDVVALDLVLGPSGTVAGRLVSQDGALAIASAEVAIAYAAPSGALGRDAFRTGPDGRFAFDAIPVGAFAIESFVPARDGIARLAGAIASDGELADLGDVRLDEEDPHVVASEPAEGDEQVAIDAAIRLETNEPLDPDSIDARAIFVRPAAGGTLAADVRLVADAAAGDLRVLEITPDAPLASETDYEVVVIDGALRDALGNVLADGPRDRVGRPLAAPFTLRFRTRDQDPPGLLSLTPPDDAIQVDPRAVVRLSFDEPITPSGVAFALTGPSGPVAGRLDAGVGARVLVFTPDAPLAPNALYSASVDGVRDVAGNLAEGLPFSSTFATLDTIGPSIASLALGGAAVGGAVVPVTAVLAEDEPGVAVRVSADLVPFGQSAPGLLSLPLALPLGGSLVVRAIAIDRFGNEGPLAELPVSIAANQPPAVAFAQLEPASGPVPSGGTLVVRVAASDDVGVATLKAAAEGAASLPLATSTGAPITLAVAIPADTGPEQSVRVLGEAIDGHHQSTGEQSFVVAVSDGSAPSVTFAAPAAGSPLVPGAPLAVELAGSDAFGIVRFELTAEGGFTASLSQDAAGAPGAATAAFSLDVPADLGEGQSVTLRARAFDAAGLAAEATLALVAPDLRAPRLVELLPPDGGSAGTQPRIAARFDEPLARASVTPERFLLRDAGGALVAAAIGFEDEDRVATLVPAAPLAAGASFRVVLASGVTDLAGNAAVNADGSAFTQREHVFVVGGAALAEPVAGQRLIEGQSFAASVVADASLGALAAEFTLNGAVAATASPDASGGFRATLTAPTLAANGGAELRVGASLALPGGGALALAEATLELLAADGDFDGDGIANGDEIAFGSDPFADDRALDDDGDGLTNADEFGLGTNPRSADSDGDGLADGDELAAGLDPLDPDSDGDGLPDGEDVLGGPRVVAIEPNAGAVNVSVRPRIRVRFDEPLARASANAASVALFAGGTAPVAAELVFAENDRVVELVPAAPLAFSTGYVLRLTSALTGTDGEPIRNADGSDVTAPIERAFTTGAFGLVEPAGGAAVRELSTLALAAAGDAALGIASVRFEVNGAAVATDDAAPFEASFAVPPANAVPVLAITAVALDAAGAELARETISVTVVVGLDVASRVFGVPLGAARDLVLRLPVARASALDVTLVSLDPAIASVPAAPQTIPAGATSLRVPVTGVAEGATTLVATTLEDTLAVSASVSALAPGAEQDAVAAPAGVAVQPFASAGLVAIAPNATSAVSLRIFAQPVAQDVVLSVESSDPAVASVPGAVVVPAGSAVASFSIAAGAGGQALLQLVGGGSGRELRVVVGAPSAAATPPVVAAPVGIAIVPFPSAGDVIVPPASARTVTLRILGEPAAGDTELVIASSDPAIAQVAGPVVIPAGSTDATFEITTGAAGSAIVTLVAGDDGRELRVVVGAPDAAHTPPVVAPPIGVAIVPFASAGDVIVPASSARTVTLRILGAPAATDTEVAVTSSDDAIAQVAGFVVIAAGSTDATFEITTGAAGSALLTLVAGGEGRELRVVSGAPDAANTPPVVAPPVGVVVVPFPSAGDVIVPASSVRSVTLRVLAAPAASDTELVVTTSDPAVAQIAGPVVIPAGSTDATFEIATGAAGSALVTLVAGDEGRALRIVSGDPDASQTPPVVAPPLGLAVLETGSAGTLFLDPGGARTFELALLAFPSLGDLPVSAVSLDPAVATVGPAAQVIATGERSVTLTVTATADAGAETRIDLRFGVDRRTLRVVVGVPSAQSAPAAIAPPVGIEVSPPPEEPGTE
ncbi:MAG: hypothetical protein DCC71_18835, partial [Proteobacteria bacterium]